MSWCDQFPISPGSSQSSNNHQITAIRDALRANPELKVSLLTDALRGTREAPNPSCASLLASLTEEFGPDRVDIRVYHTPNLTGARKKYIPKRINEGWGLQHMKLYGIDDEIIMSGANLSDDYFTNRQDRYHVFKSRDVTEYFHTVYRTVCNLSYRVRPAAKTPGGFELEWPSDNIQPSPLSDPEAYVKSAGRSLAPLFKITHTKSVVKFVSDTKVYPLLQLTPLLKPDVSTELPALTGVLRKLGTPEFAGSKWTFTAGYFNMTPEVRQLLLDSNPASATVVAASPWAKRFLRKQRRQRHAASRLHVSLSPISRLCTDSWVEPANRHQGVAQRNGQYARWLDVPREGHLDHATRTTKIRASVLSEVRIIQNAATRWTWKRTL